MSAPFLTPDILCMVSPAALRLCCSALCQSLAKRFGLPYLDTQAILTLKLKAKERVEADDE